MGILHLFKGGKKDKENNIFDEIKNHSIQVIDY